MNKRVIGLTLLPFLVAPALAACSSGPAQVKVKGTVEVDYSTSSGVSDPYSDGTQVVVYNSDNQVIATGTLANQSFSGSVFADEADTYTFSVTVPDGLPRYGIEVGGQHGIVWESEAQMKAGPGLTLDLTGGSPLGGF